MPQNHRTKALISAAIYLSCITQLSCIFANLYCVNASIQIHVLRAHKSFFSGSYTIIFLKLIQILHCLFILLIKVNN